MAIKTREFWTEGRFGEGRFGYGIDDKINDFVKEKHYVELIDIKYHALTYEKDGECIIRTSALVIYKEVN